jgi:hypothetical protein
MTLAVISNTLVMAVNENIKKIIIFSRSKLVPNTRKALADFSATLDIKIQVFDDEALESLILKYIDKKEIKNFFPHFSKIENKEFKFRREVDQFLSSEVQLHAEQVNHSQDKSNPRSFQVDANTPCVFQITVYPDIKKHSLSLDLSKIIAKGKDFNFVNRNKLDIRKGKITKELEAGELYSLRINFIPIKIGEQEIPCVDIFVDNKKFTTTNPEKYKVDKITRPFLIGEKINQFLVNLRKNISSSNRIHTSIISGKSGVGKSRSMEESINILHEENFQICKLDGKENRCNSFNSFAINILTQLWRLPNPEIFLEEKCNEECNKNFHDIIEFCLAPERIVPDDVFQKTCQLVKDGIIKQTRVAIFIDNVQSLDKKSIALLREMVNQTGKFGQISIFLTFNTEEFIYSKEAASFYKNISEELKDSNALLFELEDFTDAEVNLFIDQHLKYIGDDFSVMRPELIKLIKKNILNRPLDLYLFFKLLHSEGIAKLEEGIFSISDFSEFNTALLGINKETYGILNKRFAILESDSEAIDILHILRYWGDIGISTLTDTLNFDIDKIDSLLEECWLKKLSNGKIGFYHPKIERFIIEKQNFNKKRLLEKLESFDGFHNQPLIKFILNSSKKELLTEAIEAIAKINTDIPNPRNKMYATSVYNYITDCGVHPSIYVKVSEKTCLLMAEKNHNDTIKYLHDFCELLKNHKPEEDEACAYFQVIRQHGSFLADDNTDEAINILINGLRKLKDFTYLSTEKRNFICMNLKNRLCVCYRRKQKYKEGCENGEEAAQKAKELGNIAFECLCYLDLGYLFFGLEKYKEQTIKYWRKAIEILTQNEERIKKEDKSIFYVALVAKAYLKAIDEEDYESAISMVEDNLKTASEEFSLSTEIKSLFQKIIFETKINPLNFKDIFFLIENYLDKSQVMYDAKSQRAGFHLKGITLERENCSTDTEHYGKGNAFEMFKTALELLKQKTYFSASDEALIWDTGYLCKEKGFKFPFNDSQLINMNSYKEFCQFISNNNYQSKPFMIFSDESFNYPT